MAESDGNGRRRVLVTGGGGFLGAAVVRRLVARGDAVTSFSRHRHPALDDLNVAQAQGDLANAEAVADACRGKAAVFHTAAKAGVWGPFDAFYRPNTLGTRHVIDGCRRHGVPCLIHTSSPSVIFDGTDMEGVDENTPYPAVHHAAYPRTKAMAEREVLAAAGDGLRTIVLRPHLIWGPGDPHLVPRIIARARRLRIVGKGNNRVDTIYIDNAADAHILAAERLSEEPALSGKVYFISDDEPVVLWDMINAILKAAGLPPVTRSVPLKAAWTAGLALETLFRLFRLPGEPPMTRFVAEELATAHWFDIGAAKRDLGYRPQVSVAEGLERLEHWLEKRKE